MVDRKGVYIKEVTKDLEGPLCSHSHRYRIHTICPPETDGKVGRDISNTTKASVQITTQRKQAQREQPKKQPKKEREMESYHHSQPKELHTEMED